MIRENVEWFGALTPNIAIPVVAAGTNIETITYFHNNVSGSPMLATDASGTLLWNESYLPYGERLNDNDDSNNRLWFTGKPYDNDSGLSYMGARYYNPVLGRFMGVDPKGFDTDNVHSFNRYAYANNNPYKYVDPDGRMAIPALFIAGSALITAQAIHIYTTNPKAKAAADRLFNWVSGIVKNESAEASPPKGGDSEGKQDVTKRPSRVRKGTEQANWDNAADGENGSKVCPTCGGEVSSKPGEKNKDWDNDHNPPWRDRDLSGKDRKGVLDEYNRDTRLRCIGCNRSDNGS